MLKRFSTTEGANSQKPALSKDHLLIKLVRLVRQNGYSRDKVVSDLLKRYLPPSRYSGASAEAELRRSFDSTEIDGKTLAYLVDNVEVEIQLSRERIVG